MTKFRNKQGTAITEFMFVFPAFLILALFTIEICFTWTDKHIMRLAAFEAARSLTSVPLPTRTSAGLLVDDPCLSDTAMRNAKQAAYRRMAVVSPSILYFNSRLGPLSSRINGGAIVQTTSMLPTAAKRLLLRWPTAVALTHLACTYSAEEKSVDLQLTYYRSPDTPIVGRVMWVTHLLNKAGSLTTFLRVGLKPDFYGIEVKGLDPAGANALRTVLSQAFTDMQSIDMATNDATDYLRSVPGVDALLGEIPDLPNDLISLGSATRSMAASLGATNLIANDVRRQSELLTAAVYTIPDALRVIPLTTSVKLVSEIAGPNAIATSSASGVSLKDQEWRGLITAVGRMNSGNYNGWSRHMSIDSGYIRDGEAP